MRHLLHILFFVLAAFALWATGSVCKQTVDLIDEPFLGLSMTESAMVHPTGLITWGAQNAGFEMWDHIVAVDGQRVMTAEDAVEIGTQGIRSRANAETKKFVNYQVLRRDGSNAFISFDARIFTLSDLMKSHTLLAWLGLLFVVVASLLYVIRPGTAEAWAFFVLFAAMGTSMASVVDLTMFWRLPPLFQLLGPFLGTFGVILVGVVVRAYSRPEGDPVVYDTFDESEPSVDTVATTNKVRASFIITLLMLAVSITVALTLVLAEDSPYRYTVIDSVFYVWLVVSLGIALGMLLFAYVKTTSPRRRARVRQILWAWPVGAGVPVLNLFTGQVLELQPMSMIWNAFLLLVPISTADAIVRHDLLRLDRSTRKVVGEVTIASVIGIALGFSLWFAVQWLRIDDDAPAMAALAALLFAVAAPLTHRAQSHLEVMLRSRRYDANRLVAEFSARASTATQLENLVEQLKDTLNRSLQPKQFELFRYDKSEQHLAALLSGQVLEASTLVNQWLNDPFVVVVDDESPAPAVLRSARLAVRLAVANEPVGLFVIGARNDSLAYDENDIAFFAALSGPLAAAVVNTLAFETVESLNRQLEQRVMERTAELETKNIELATLNQRKDELVATISHDFRSPLAVIRQNVQTILRDLLVIDRDDLKMFLDGVLRQEHRLTALCTNLLDLARLRQKSVERSVVNVQVIVRNIVSDLTLRAQERGIALTMQHTDVDTFVMGDADRLGQVFQNLIDNALKFTPPQHSVDVNVIAHPSTISVIVKDTGVGVPADVVDRLFDPFYQVPSTQNAGTGSGLGLAIVKAVIDAHEGKVTVVSTLNEGTTFTVVLPRHHMTDENDNRGTP